jgi:hypothetical protein
LLGGRIGLLIRPELAVWSQLTALTLLALEPELADPDAPSLRRERCLKLHRLELARKLLTGLEHDELICDPILLPLLTELPLLTTLETELPLLTTLETELPLLTTLETELPVPGAAKTTG